MVLDPSGEASHGGLPATWRPLTDDVGVVWCRLPAVHRQGLAGDNLLPQLAGDRQRIHLVGIGSSALLAVALAMSHRDLVRSLIVVDPPWRGADLAEVRRFGDEGSLVIHQIETTNDTASATLPIGHPEVVRAIVRVLVGADARPDSAGTPGRVGQALNTVRDTVRDKVAEALEAFADELGDRGMR